MIRVAAIGDLAVAERGRSARTRLDGVARKADVLLVAGDLTADGTVEQGKTVAEDLSDLGLPTIAVLGERDTAAGHGNEIAANLQAAGIIVLEGDGVALEVAGTSLGVSGTTGFPGGFDRDAIDRASDEQREQAAILGDTLLALGTRLRIALLHYAPVTDTLVGEAPERWPTLGHGLLSSAIDRGRASFAVHAHAGGGSEHGATVRGVPVRNVTRSVIGAKFRVYSVGGSW